MNAIVNIGNFQKTMSHREVAELTGKEQRHVKRDCDVMFKELDLSAVGYAQSWAHPQNGQTYIEYMLPRDLVETLITGYNIKLRHAVLKRWRELEDQAKSITPSLPNFLDPAEAARAWAQEFEAKRLAEQQIAILAPKAQALDAIANTSNTYTIRECAKNIGIGERELVQLLIARKWVYRDESKRVQPYADKVQKGVFINRTSPVIVNKNDGQERVFLHMRVTAFGLTRISGLVNKVKAVAA